MTDRARYRPLPGSPRLWRRTTDEPPSFWTEALCDPPSVYGERIAFALSTVLRRWDPSRSKLGAAISKGWDRLLPTAGERWLYLGAATGTTLSHVADLVGPSGAAYGVEKSVRPFAKLLRLAERYPNIGPLLADVRRWTEYAEWVPPVDGLYVDVAQPDQVAIARENARVFLKPNALLLLALKTASMGRELSARQHLERAVRELEGGIEVEEALPLDPFHRRHFLVGGRATPALFEAAVSRPIARRAARRS
ncbi:MAG TPA: fibrillarin-like rRNA/tRNA 2'-O-methyltransferase [Thermoplasmata archaeon]|nr:fibrillarin-like rRNA/tRNA 2'-O-methyltransferase [Thermoplasmata archaeon]